VIGAAARTSAGLSLLFLAVYGSCNWITAQRSDVGTWYFEWERLIPFVPLMILPYMSIDLFFVGGPFLCRDRVELRTLRSRIVLAILVAGAGFLLLPLRFAFERPVTTGWLGALFDGFRTLDQPHNLVPSLHIALRSTLVDLYARHTAGLLRAGMHVWFSLIGFSTVLTYQHHIVDVVAGFALAAVCFWAIRESSSKLPVTPNPRVATLYLGGAVVAGGLAATAWPWTASCGRPSRSPSSAWPISASDPRFSARPTGGCRSRAGWSSGLASSASSRRCSTTGGSAAPGTRRRRAC
jgi:membrane-associated phospholipid phosphatase